MEKILSKFAKQHTENGGGTRDAGASSNTSSNHFESPELWAIRMELKLMCHRPLCSADECTCSPCYAVANKTCFCRWSALDCRLNITFGSMHASALYECMKCNHLSKSMNEWCRKSNNQAVYCFSNKMEKARRMHIECPIVWFNSSIDLLVPVGDCSMTAESATERRGSGRTNGIK